MLNFQKNNLDQSSSPYLLQHKKNPIHWQDWNQETLDYANKNNKLILVSIGYSTCHWCHVMAKEAFSDHGVADFLNKYFVSIKIDREQRPDIDQYFMDFLIQTKGQGGWPLNIILSPDQKPFFAGTYFPLKARYGLPAFLDLLRQLIPWYEQHKKYLQTFTIKPPASLIAGNSSEKTLIDKIKSRYDQPGAGFSESNQFPPHNTLLFLMAYFQKEHDPEIGSLITETLEIMANRGLHDHLQGGFYRYCTDREWNIPHFEKMLYDQAMHLWTYSNAYKLFHKKEYKDIADKIIECLEQSFEKEGLFYSALDAETEHEEGTSYLWSYDELQKNLRNHEFQKFQQVYEITPTGNFENKNHLLKKKNLAIASIEKKLLKLRKKRPQPAVDYKIITSWNALTGIALIQAYRHTGNKHAYQKAENLFQKLLKKHYIKKKLIHSSFKKILQKEEFLEDYASFLLFTTYIYEETGRYKDLIQTLKNDLAHFHDQIWYLNPRTKDFIKIPAQHYDHPTPSAVSLAELAQHRSEIILEKTTVKDEKQFLSALESDFYNLTVFFQKGHHHEIHSPQKIPWTKLPLASMQLPGKKYQDCYQHQCHIFNTQKALLKYLTLF